MTTFWLSNLSFVIRVQSHDALQEVVFPHPFGPMRPRSRLCCGKISKASSCRKVPQDSLPGSMDPALHRLTPFPSQTHTLAIFSLRFLDYPAAPASFHGSPPAFSRGRCLPFLDERLRARNEGLLALVLFGLRLEFISRCEVSRVVSRVNAAFSPLETSTLVATGR